MKLHNCLFILCFCSNVVFGSTLPKSSPVPGGVVIIDLGEYKNFIPKVYYQKKRSLVMQNPNKPNNYLAIIGIGLDADTGSHYIEVDDGNLKKINFVIKDKQYPHERLTIPNQRKVTPLAQDLAQIKQEQEKTRQTYDRWHNTVIKSTALKTPIKGRKSSPFGRYRTMNNIKQQPHSGLDIAALKGTEIIAPKDGIVTNIGNYFYNGNIVFLDHGQGFITSYCHLDSINVKLNDRVKQGDIIGKVGNTGRATGPHLHWSVSLNGMRVDPELFIDE